jgi:hypothetical protein
VQQAEERDGEGLWVKGLLDLDNPTGRQVYKLLKGGRVTNFSFAYDVIDSEMKDDGINALQELKLYEVGPTLIGCNQSTRTLAVKDNKAVSDKPWSDFTKSDYSDEQWQRACILDRGGDGTAKQRYALPVREPAGALNRNGCHAAASVLGGGRGGVDASPEAKRSAARTLVGLYRNQLGEDPPESLTNAAKADDVTTKAGRVLSAKNESDLRDAVELIEGVLAQLGAPMPDEPDGTSSTTAASKTSANAPAKPEEPDRAKGKEPNRGASVNALAAILSLREKEVA